MQRFHRVRSFRWGFALVYVWVWACPTFAERVIQPNRNKFTSVAPPPASRLKAGICICQKSTDANSLCELIRKPSLESNESEVLARKDFVAMEREWGGCDRESCIKEPNFQTAINDECGGSAFIARDPEMRWGTFLDRAMPNKCWCEATLDGTGCHLFQKNKEGNIKILESAAGLAPDHCSSQHCLRHPRWSASITENCGLGLIPGPRELPTPSEYFDAFAIPTGACFCEADREAKQCVLTKKVGQLLVPLDARSSDLPELGQCRLEPCLNSHVFRGTVATACPGQVQADGTVRVNHLVWTKRLKRPKVNVTSGNEGRQTAASPEELSANAAAAAKLALKKYLATTPVTEVIPLKYNANFLPVRIPPPFFPRRLKREPDDQRRGKLQTALDAFATFDGNVLRTTLRSQINADLTVNKYNADQKDYWFPYLKYTKNYWNRPLSFSQVNETLFTLSYFLSDYSLRAQKQPTRFEHFGVAQGPEGQEYLTSVGKDRVYKTLDVVIHFDPDLTKQGGKVPLRYEDFQVYRQNIVGESDWKILDRNSDFADPDGAEISRFVRNGANNHWQIGFRLPGNSETIYVTVSDGYLDPYTRRGSYGRLHTVFQGWEDNLKTLLEERKSLDDAYAQSLAYVEGKIKNSASPQNQTDWIKTDTVLKEIWQSTVAEPEK